MRIDLNIEACTIHKYLVGNEWKNTIGNTTMNVCLGYTRTTLCCSDIN